MSESPKRYWMSVVERDSPGLVHCEAENGDPNFTPTRRSFLKAAGFSFGALAVSSCRGPEVDAIPYVQQPDGVVPGRPLHYATTCGACEARCGLLVTTRDGRPVKIEGNPDHPFSGGSTCAVGQASILGLYDSLRLAYPTKGGQQATWADVDAEIAAALAPLKQERPRRPDSDADCHEPDDRSGHRRLPGRIRQRAARHLRSDLLVGGARGSRADARRPPDAAVPLRSGRRHRQHRRRFPGRLDLARPVHARVCQPAADQRDRAPTKSYHVQIESRLSLTGSNADRRLRVAPGEIGHVDDAPGRASWRSARARAFAAEGLAASPWDAAIEAIAERLWTARGRGLVVSGSQDVRVQALCNFINQTIGAYGATVDLARPSYQRAGNDAELAALRAELSRGEVGALFVAGRQPGVRPAGRRHAGERYSARAAGRQHGGAA